MLEFSNPYLLAGMAAAALPVLAHLLTRARPRTIRYPTFRLLLEAGGGRQSLNRLRTLLILLLRTLALLALALVFAKPLLTQKQEAGASTEARRVVLIVDASLSMRAAADGVNLFSRSASQAADLLRSLEEGSQAGLILAGAAPQAVLPALSQNLPVLHQALEKARPSLEVCDAAGALALAAQMLNGSGTIYVFSDFQRTNWGAAEYARYPGVRFVLKPALDASGREAALAQYGPENAGLGEIALSPAEPLPGEAVSVSCRVFNSAPGEKAIAVTLEVEGQPSQVQELRLPPFASGAANFQVVCAAPGLLWGKASLPQDALAEDNTRVFALKVRSELRAMLVSDEAGRGGTTANLAGLALAPPGGGTGIRLIARRGGEVDSRAAAESQVFVLVPPVTLDNGTAGVLAERMRDGATVMFFLSQPGDRTVLGALESASAGALTLPLETGEAVQLPTAEAGVSLTTAGRAQLALFANPAEADLAGVRFATYLRAKIAAGHEDEIWLTYRDGSPALSASAAGRGRLYLWNVPLSPQAGTLAGSPLFPGLLHELLRKARTGSGGNDATPGQRWQMLLPPDWSGAPSSLSVTDPAGTAVEFRLERGTGGGARVLLPVAQSCGVYRVSDAQGMRALGVVNPDARESDLRALPLRSLQESGGGAVTVAESAGDLLAADKDRALWPALLLAAGLALFAELLLTTLWRKNSRRGQAAVVRGAGGAIAAQATGAVGEGSGRARATVRAGDQEGAAQ